MSPKEFTGFRIAPELLAGLRAVKERDLIPMSIQVDQALRMWLKSRRMKFEVKKTAKRSARTPRKP